MTLRNQIKDVIYVLKKPFFNFNEAEVLEKKIEILNERYNLSAMTKSEIRSLNQELIGDLISIIWNGDKYEFVIDHKNGISSPSLFHLKNRKKEHLMKKYGRNKC